MTQPGKTYDVFVIGGGINGLGIARDAVGRGLSVGLCEKDDLASHTSSSSTKLIHGGLRYLEHYDFNLVRKALIEREVLLQAAPHIIWPMRFVLPLTKGGRPAWLIRLGLFLYDYIGGRKILPPTKTLTRRSSRKLDPLIDDVRRAFEYSDCWVDDARLCVLNGVDAAERGADILTRHTCTALERSEEAWTITLSPLDGEPFTVSAKALVNAAGPWVEAIGKLSGANPAQTTVRLVKGSHIVTAPLFSGDHAYFFQNPDGRIFFAIPYENGDYTLIGTTDVAFDSQGLDKVEISDTEIDYLCTAANAYFKPQIDRSSIIWTYSGVRPLYDDQAADASEVTRDYVLKYDQAGAPMLSVFGGKITTYRTLAEAALRKMSKSLPDMEDAWTADTPLPGGDMPEADFEAFERKLEGDYPDIDSQLLKRLARLYGTRAHNILKDAISMSDLGDLFGANLSTAEVDYLIRYEFARTADDILYRRTKLGLHMSEAEAARFQDWFPARLDELRINASGALAVD